MQRFVGGVDVVPCQAERLADPQPGAGQDDVQVLELIAGSGVDQCANLFGTQDARLFDFGSRRIGQGYPGCELVGSILWPD